MTRRQLPGVGLGVDVHRFGGPGPVRLGGVEIEHPQGLLGHSDGDVLCHAFADALLGASGLGDIGEHFPSGEERWRGASSLDLLHRVGEMLGSQGLEILGMDGTVIAEAPRLGPFRQEMQAMVAAVLSLDPGLVSVKVKSSDGLGLTGRGEGMAALAVARVGLGSRTDPE
ncbi:MAG TPA: 2-C-methyl-D-erythritol 2,4-cyclodiphosphate synthase [Candidatus Dormibacteraeota bacterium]|nr:2-C-methyl-D-erythritol 2,4-cyclodiphosphate synthase [Candidatus Dormibacteraeota bacterium]